MIAQELKKIFEIKKVLLIFILTVLFYVLFFRNNIGIPSHSSERVDAEVSLAMIGTYGNELDQTEYRDLLNNLAYAEKNNSEVSDIDVWIKGNDDFLQYGIENYGDLVEIQDSLSDDAAIFLTSQVNERFTEEERRAALDDVFKEAYTKILVEAYDAETRSDRQTAYYTEIPENAQKRIEERNQEEVYSLMPDNIMRRYLAILPDFAIFLFLSMILLIVPYSVKDTMEGVNILQYASLKGGRFYWKKTAFVFIASVILIAIEIGFFILMIIKNYTFYFWDCFVSGFRNPFITFVKLTFGQFIIMSLAYIMLTGICLSMITYGLSSCAHNYISAIALQIPVIIFSIVLSLTLMPHFVEITQNILLLFMIPLICLFVAAIGNVVRFLFMKFREYY